MIPTGETEVLAVKPVPLPFCSPKFPHARLKKTCKGKRKIVPVHVPKPHRRSGGITPLILNFENVVK